MAQQPTTWKTVTAPDFKGANVLAYGASQLQGDALDSAGNSFSNLVARQQQNTVNDSVFKLHQAAASGMGEEDLFKLSGELEVQGQKAIANIMQGRSDLNTQRLDNNFTESRTGLSQAKVQAELFNNAVAPELHRDSLLNTAKARQDTDSAIARRFAASNQAQFDGLVNQRKVNAGISQGAQRIAQQGAVNDVSRVNADTRRAELALDNRKYGLNAAKFDATGTVIGEDGIPRHEPERDMKALSAKDVARSKTLDKLKVIEFKQLNDIKTSKAEQHFIDVNLSKFIGVK